ncbi:hypothetical protein LUZ60_005019 [Juncus effusus]|nr:hypothetical protein LUZ60_005019 [Juncus effusus]
MVFTDAFRSKLSSLLRPWLADKDREPQLDLRLGFLSSELKTKKLEFDVSVLNSGLDDESVFVFEKFEAKDVDLRVSPWFKPSVDVRVGSLDVTVSPRELGSGNRRDDCKNLDEKEKKEIIALIDSEGSILHEMIETLSVKFSQNRLLTNIKLSILKSFNIKFDEINLSLHCSDKPYFLTLKAKDLLFYLGEFKFTLSPIENLNPKMPTICLGLNCATFINSIGYLNKFSFVSLGEIKLRLERENLVLYSEPASLALLSERKIKNVEFLRDNLEELWLNWTQISEMYNDLNVGSSTERPFLLFEFKSSNFEFGLEKCGLILGKLNLNLEYQLILLIYQFYLMSNNNLNGEEIQSLSNPSISDEETQVFKLYTNQFKKLGLGFTPQKEIEIATLILGPQIRVKLEDRSIQELFLDLDTVEFYMLPKMETIENHQNPFLASNMKYTCKSLNAHEGYLNFANFGIFVEDLKENSMSRIFGPISVKFEFSTFRESLESLCGSDIFLSSNLNGGIFGISTDLYMDEILSLFQGFKSMQYTISSSSPNLFSAAPLYSPNFMKKSTNSSIKTTNWNNNNNNLQLMADFILDIEPVEIMIKHSRDSDPNPGFQKPGIEKPGIGFSVSKSQIKFSVSEKQTEFLIELVQLKSLISDSSDLSRVEKMDCFSLSKLKFGFLFDDSCKLDVGIEVFRVFLGDYELNESLMSEIYEPLVISLIISDNLQSVVCKIQGGFIFMETSTLAKFANCINAYYYFERSRVSEPSSSARPESIRVSEASSSQTERIRVSENSSSQRESSFGFFLIKDFNMDLSQFSLTLALANQSGEIQELNISTTTNLQILNFSKTISFNLSGLSISKNNWTKSKLSPSSQNSNSSLSPHFRSEFSPNLPILRVEEFEGSNLNFPTNEGCICKDIKIVGKIEKNNLEREIGLVKLMSDWIGKVVLSGLDFYLSLSTIQMLSDLFAPLNGIKSGTKGQKSTQIIQSDDQNRPNNSDCKIPEGAIVTLMDLDQHMYISIEDTETKCRVVGSPHYSLAGKRALFRVRHHKKWRSEEQIVSFTSIYSQNNNYNQNNIHNNNNSKPICLSYNSKSDFVSTSSNPDKPFSHWKLIPAPNPNYSEDYDKSFNSVPENHPNTFYLVNYKNTLGIKFIDGFPEFVKKPGNPFKIRVLDESTINGLYMDWNLLEGSGANENAPAVQIRVENISVTVSHEVSDVKYEVPLLRGCVNDVNVSVHCCDDKIRVLASFDVSGRYFDARRDEWKDIIPPVSSFCFFRYRFLCQKPIRCFFSMKQMNFYINELLVDVLLYLVGKLDLMGPYAVKNSTIFPNSCKIENQSGLSLLCHFPNQQDVTVPPKQSSSLLLRHLAVGNEETQKQENSVSICLVKQNAFSTSQINISLVDSRVFAWRTRITSLNDSRSFPGPFIVVDVSKQFEEGLCISVSPLLKLHNKTELPVELRFTRPGESIDESAAFVTLRNGEVIDESMGLFDAIELTGGSKRALLSLALGNFLLSFRPVIPDQLKPPNSEPVLADWSENITGEKPTRISGVFDKLNFKLKRAFGAYSFKSLFSSLSCPFYVKNQQRSDLHFLIHTLLRDVPLQKPSSRERNSTTSPSSSSSSSSSRERNSSPVALQMQREIFIYPTVQVSNFLQMDVRVVLSEKETDITSPNSTFGRDSIIPSNSSSYFYVDPSPICVSVTLIPTNSKSKTLNSTECVRKLRKTENQFLDLELEFESGKYFAGLRLLRGDKGLLEVAIFTKYTLHNSTELPLLCTTSYLKSLTRLETGHESGNISPEHGCYLSPGSSASWFAKSTEVHIKSTAPATSVSHLNMDALSAFTEIRLETQNPNFDSNCQLAVLGVSLNPLLDKVDKVSLMPAQLVRIVPRYVVSNDSSHDLMVRQCYVEDNSDGIPIKPNRQITLLTTKPKTRSKETFFDSLLKPHKSGSDESRIFLQFRPLNGSANNDGFGWSGPVCAASLGRFYVKFRKNEGNNLINKFGIVRVLEENNSLVLRFGLDCGNELPYRIENHLSGVSVMYSQKGSIEADVLGSGESADYIWDDINLPHKLVVRIVDMNLLREISIDKICAWRPFFKMRQNKTLGLDLSLLEKGLFRSEKGQNSDESVKQRPVLEIGYEVYFDGQTRVLRLCQRGGGSAKSENLRDRFANLRFRAVSFCLHFRESNNQIVDELPVESTVVILNLAYVSLDSVITNQQKHISARIQAINADERWSGAKFGSILRRSQTNDFGSNENILSVVLVLSSKKSSIKLVDYFSSVLQPIDLKIDEDTLMKLVPFWRSSLSDPNTPSQKYYFKHFEIHPIKIIASFQPGISNTTYTSTQEALRSLLHTVVKVPAISNSVVELNGVLLNHALVTSRELALKCAQHYSWYILRAVYVAKGSKLLPPTFASIFDDSALSSLDVFFDPSDGSISLPGVTIGMFKFISKGIKSKGVFGTKRYFGDLGKTIKRAGSKALFAVVTEISDNVLRGAETNGFNGMMNGFHQGIMRLAMEPSVLGLAIMDGGPDRKIKLDRNPGLDELYIEGYLQGMLDVTYKLEYLRVRVIDDQVILKNLPPSSTVMKEIMENVKSFLVSKALLKGDSSTSSRPLRHLHSEREWRLGPTLLTLCEHLFVGFAIRFLQNQSAKISTNLKQKAKTLKSPQEDQELEESKKGINPRFNTRVWAVGRFVLSGLIAYVDGRLCRNIPNPIVRRIVSGFLLSFLDRKDATQS